MLIAGVDENGLGPRLGPLIVTAIALEVPGKGDAALVLDAAALPSIRDSKQIFRRTARSYAAGEAAALALLEARPETRDATDFSGLVSALTRTPPSASVDEAVDLHVAPLTLPLWGGEPAPVARALAARGIRVVDVACRLVFPAELNRERCARGGKLALDYRAFEDALALLDVRPPLALLGKIGGARRYGPWLEASSRLRGIDTLEEDPACSRYRCLFEGVPLEMRFVRDGDDTLLAIAAASVVGKYVREASMLCFNRALGFDAPIPHASGYWSDPKTAEAISRYEERFASRWSRDAVIREG